jgi:hypothetical protein
MGGREHVLERREALEEPQQLEGPGDAGARDLVGGLARDRPAWK